MAAKRLFLLNVLLAVAITGAVARLAADFASYRLSRLFPKTMTKVASPPAPPLSEDLSAYSTVLERGLFGKATQGKLAPITQPVGKGVGGGVSTADLVLLGTARGSFRETFALVRKTSTQEERVFRLGERVFDTGPLVSVGKESAEVLMGGRRVRIFTPTALPVDQPQPAGSIAPASAGLATQVAAGSYVIDQRALNAALDNIGQAMTDARLLPSIREGKVEGFRVSEVKPAGIFGMVGIRNGDVLMRINDFAVDSPEKAIQSLASLKGMSRLKLDLVRDGQPATFNYEIR